MVKRMVMRRLQALRNLFKKDLSKRNLYKRNLCKRDMYKRDLSMRNLFNRDLCRIEWCKRDLSTRDLFKRGLSKKYLCRRDLSKRNFCKRNWYKISASADGGPRSVQQVCSVASWSLPRGSTSSAMSLPTGITMEGTMIDPITHSGLKASKVTNQILS